MRKIHKHRLAKLAIELIKAVKGARIRMEDHHLGFCMENLLVDSEGDTVNPHDYECGTSCCALGFAPFVFPYCRRMHNWGDVMEYLAGDKSASNSIEDFLYARCWPSDAKQLGARTLTLLQADGIVLDDYLDDYLDGDVEYHTELSKAKLIEALSKYITPGKPKAARSDSTS